MIPITLASGSAIRAKILRDAGVSFDIARPGVDEAAIKSEMTAQGASARQIVQALARAKGSLIAQDRAGLVIGSDQILIFEGVLYDKAENLTQARDRLAGMRARAHSLVGATAIYLDGSEIALIDSQSDIWLRDFSDAFLDAYIEAEGEAILTSVACYKFEERGAQLFERIDGDHYAILGLPLLPVLAVLRTAGGLAA